MIEEELKELVKKGYFKIGDITYMIEGYAYPHDERCEGSMCWCSVRAKKENPLKWAEYKRGKQVV